MFYKTPLLFTTLPGCYAVITRSSLAYVLLKEASVQ